MDYNTYLPEHLKGITINELNNNNFLNPEKNPNSYFPTHGPKTRRDTE